MVLSDGENKPTPLHGRFIWTACRGAMSEPYFPQELYFPAGYDVKAQKHYFYFNESVDYWALGVLLYDLTIFGLPKRIFASVQRKMGDFFVFKSRAEQVLRDEENYFVCRGNVINSVHISYMRDFILRVSKRLFRVFSSLSIFSSALKSFLRIGSPIQRQRVG